MSHWDIDDRFEVVAKKGMLSSYKVIVDRETGVQYLHWAEGNAGGMTVLVDRDGKPLLYHGLGGNVR